MFDVDQMYRARNGVGCRSRSHSEISSVDTEDSMYVLEVFFDRDEDVHNVNKGVCVVGITGEVGTISYYTCLVLIYTLKYQ
jgi:hypothetical protein